MPTARLAQASDLESLLDLFRVSEVSSIADPTERIEHIWSETLTHQGLALFVSEAGARIAATCMLIARRTFCAADVDTDSSKMS
jgi:hypothetical protein